MSIAPWKILHVALDQPLEAIEATPGHLGAHVFFWWRRVPLGHARLFAAQLPMPPATVAQVASRAIAPALGDHLLDRGFRAPLPGFNRRPPEAADLAEILSIRHPLAALDAKLSASDSLPIRATVAVCTRERPDPLRRCLESLRRLRVQPLEIVVVDNAPKTEATRRVVSEFEGARYVCEPRPGLDAARNAALRAAQGEIIAFADDDVVADPDWLAGLARGFQSPNVMAVTGLVLPAELETDSQVMFETHWTFNRGYRARVYGPEFLEGGKRQGPSVTEIGAGANMAFRREVIESVGWFDERLDAGAAGCNGDSEYWYRVLAAGHQCRYEPTAVIHHYHRRDMDGFKRQIFYYMRGYTTALLVQSERHRNAGNLRRLFVGLPSHYARCFCRAALGRMGSQTRTLGVEILGCFSGLLYYWRIGRKARP